MKEEQAERQYYRIDGKQFDSLTKAWLRRKDDWKKRRQLVAAMLILAGVIFCAVIFAVMRIARGNNVVVVSVILGMFAALVPLIAARILYVQGRLKFGKPFVTMRNPFLCSDDWGIWFGYHDTLDKRNSQSMTVEQIAFSNIRWLEIDKENQLITVYGRKESIEYDDMTAGIIRHSYTKGQFGERAAISFFLCFQDAERFFAVLKHHNIPIRNR